MEIKKCQKNALLDIVCSCGRSFQHRSSLWRHKKTCFNNVEDNIVANIDNNISNSGVFGTGNCYDNKTDFKELVLLLLKENKEIQKSFVDLIPHIKGNNNTNSNNCISNTTNNHNNNQFNINMFLNEHCKNAMNLTDFIDSLPITAETYDSTIENGLTKTITSMLVNGLSKLDILDRPIHCTDATRKTLYVKDDDTWEKDNELLHLIKGIKTLSMKQRTMINKWQDANLGWDTKENLQSRLTRLVYNSMTSIENDDKETGKIIRAVSKNVYLDNDTKDHYPQLK